MVNQLLSSLKKCPNCGSDKSLTRDDRHFCYMCETPLVEHVPTNSWNQKTPSWPLGQVQGICSTVLSNERLTLIWQKLGRRKVVVGSGLFGILLLGSGLILGARN
uniref:hypothetical protein n=1 Tax=Acaryochloris thomasi TaxID=2929456 RepID=UPI001314DD96